MCTKGIFNSSRSVLCTSVVDDKQEVLQFYYNAVGFYYMKQQPSDACFIYKTCLLSDVGFAFICVVESTCSVYIHKCTLHTT